MAKKVPVGPGSRSAKDVARTQLCEDCGGALRADGTLVYCADRCGFSRIVKDSDARGSRSPLRAEDLDEDVDDEEEGGDLADGLADEEEDADEVGEGADEDGAHPPENRPSHRPARSTSSPKKSTPKPAKRAPEAPLPPATQLAAWLALYPDKKRREILSAASAIAATREMMEKL